MARRGNHEGAINKRQGGRWEGAAYVCCPTALGLGATSTDAPAPTSIRSSPPCSAPPSRASRQPSAANTKIVYDTVRDAKDRLPEWTGVTGVVEGANRRCW
jgi:hypothetical protein